MSLIDQALKKTQSALKQKAQTTSSTQPIIDKVDKPEPIRPAPAVHAIPKKYKKTSHTVSDFGFNGTDFLDFITNRWVIGAASFVFMAMLVLTMHQYVLHIGQRYTQFYGHLFQHVLPVKNKSKLVTTPPKPVVPMKLNGTLQMENQHVALINHQLYHTGETIDGYQIEEIHYNHVILQNTETHQKRELTPELSQ